jgi:hypothetical protein
MDSFNSYPSIFNFGHKAIRGLLDVPVNVEEKIDGSQFSFGKDDEGVLHIRSKGCVMVPGAPQKMFNHAWETVDRLAPILRPGWTYRAEYLSKPKHNVLAYDRIPKDYLIIFDVAKGHEDYLSYAEKEIECNRIGLECVPLLYSGRIGDIAFFRSLLDRVSVLGGQKIEGVVVKPQTYDLYGTDKKILMGKFVSEEFKEVHKAEWKSNNPTSKDILELIALQYRTPARWMKSVQHLRDEGRLEDSPRDIGPLIKETQADLLRETSDEIKEDLFKWAIKHIQRTVCHGLPEWYKELLLKQQFNNEDVN